MIQVSNSNKQMQITSSSNSIRYYMFSDMKSVNYMVSSTTGASVIINFINENRDSALVINLAEVSNQATWTNDGVGAAQAVEDISNWIEAATGGGGGGGGVQYTDGDLEAAPTGNQIMFNSSGTEKAVSNNYPLPVNQVGQSRTPVIVRDATGTDVTIGANCYSISIANVGSATATVTITGSPDVTTNLEAGEVINFEAGSPNAYFVSGLFVLNSGTSELLITYIS